MIGRLAVKKENDKVNYFIAFFAALVAILPDIDGFLHFVSPIEIFEHAVGTHTIIGALILTILFTLIVWGLGNKFLKELNINLKFLFLIALFAITSHLILDIFTYREDIWTTNAHLYFWPFSNFSFHLNAFFHQSRYPNIYTIRIIIEAIYSAILIGVIIIYGWFIKKENPLFMMLPPVWLDFISDSEVREAFIRPTYLTFIFMISILVLMAIGGIFSYLV